MKKIQKVILFFILFSPGMAVSQKWKVFSDSARLSLDRKDNGKAIEYYTKANEILKNDSALSISYAENNSLLGDMFLNTGQYPKAEPYFIIAKDLRERLQGKENAYYASACNSLGRMYRLTGNYPKAEPLLIEAREIRRRVLGTENADYATSSNNLGVLYVEMGQYDKARPLYSEALEIRKRVLGKEHADYAASCNNLAILYVVTGQYLAAEPLYIEAKSIREKVLGKDHPFYAASCNNLAALYLDRGQYKKAEPLYLESREIRQRTLGKEHPEYAASCDNLAILYMDLGAYEKAEPLYMEAKQIRENVLGKSHPDYARSCNNLGLFYRILGQFEKAESLFIEARQILATAFGKEHFEYAKSCNNLGALYMDMGKYRDAEPLYDEARQVWEKALGKEHPEYAKSCHNLGLINRFEGNNDKAIEWMLEAKGIREKAFGKNSGDYAESADNLGTLYADRGEYKVAESLINEARQIRESVFGRENPDYVQSCINLANLYNEIKDFKKADSLYLFAIQSQKAQVEKVFTFTTGPEKQSYLNKINEYKNFFLSFHSNGNYQEDIGQIYNLSLSYRLLILSSYQQLHQRAFNSNDSLTNSRYNEWINTRSQLAFLYTKPVEERKTEVAILEAKADSLEKELNRSSFSFQKKQQTANCENIRAHLGNNEAAIEFINFDYYTGKRWADSVYYMAVIIRKDRPQPELVNLFEKRSLDSLLGKKVTAQGQITIDALYRPGAAANTSGQSLYKLVWAPIEKRLNGIRTVYFSPTGSLYKIAFAALPVNNEQVLSDKYRLIQLNTTASILDKEESIVQNTDKIILYGGIQYDVDSLDMKKAALPYKDYDVAARKVPGDLLREGTGNFYFLPESEKEVNGIEVLAKQRKYSVNIFNGSAASEESFKSLSGNNSPAVIHTATHGFFFPDPKKNKKDDRAGGSIVFRQSSDPLIRSGLVLSGANKAWEGKPVEGVEDGILTAYEVSNMYLPGTRLAILSACETGLGDINGNEGVYGLQRSFKMAGVQNLVMSLWKVEDRSASEFMQEFYKNIFSKQAIHDAFYNAQTVLKNKYRNDPYKWAAWILVR